MYKYVCLCVKLRVGTWVRERERERESKRESKAENV